MGRLKCLPHLVARGDEGNIGAITHQLCFPYLKLLIFSSEIRNGLSSKPNIDWSFTFQNGFLRGDFGLCGIAGRNDRHVGQHTHGGNVLQSLMRGSVRPDRNTRMGTADDDMHIVVTHRDTNLVVGTMRRKNAVGAEHGNLAAQGQASGSCHGILLSDSHGEKPFGKSLGKEVHAY